MNLIANTGIQCFAVPLEINLNDNFKMYFHQWHDPELDQLKLEIAHCFSEEELWVKKHDLSVLGYVEKGRVTENWQNVKDDFEEEGKKTIPINTDDPKDAGCFHVSIGKINWEKFENVWFPFPFFLLNGGKSEFGPTNWCRCKLIPKETTGKYRKYSLLLAFDTRASFEDDDFEDEYENETPIFTSSDGISKDYALCNDEYKLLGYFLKTLECGWVDEYLLKYFHGVDSIKNYPVNAPKPELNYMAQYIYLMRYIQMLKDVDDDPIVPKMTLYSSENEAYGNVDLVVDIGNSRTCAILFDDSDFNKSSPLELQDFTAPVLNDVLNKCRDSFDMRLAFREADFGGNFGLIKSRQFIYPSMVRLGKEANQLIHKAASTNKGAEKMSTFSSPKRFLWDTKQQEQEWAFTLLDGEGDKPKSVRIKGISEQLNSDGSLNTTGDAAITMRYSRRALMTFAFLEILAQAKMQINSYEQRSHWGNERMPRRTGRIIVTCPTAMSRLEQVALRRCAEDAAIMLDRFFENTYRTEIDEKKARARVQVIPSAKKLSNKEERTEWIYDEATAAQFVFLYGELCECYQLNTKDFFDFYGKIRNDIGNDYNKKSLTIGSVDIGAGTTDLMIAAYKYEGDIGQSTLTPVPLFWESFYTAGDDLLKKLILQLVIEGQYSPIEKKLISQNKKPVELMQPFLGTDDGVSARDKRLRSDFNLQVSVPLVLYFLELLRENSVESKILSFSEIFGDNPPTKNVLKHFNSHFDFEFEALQWQYEKKVVAAIVEKTFDTLIGKICSLLSYYACDIVLLSGRPTSLEPLSDLFLKYYAISPNRLKTINDYRVGRWYPHDTRYKFIDGNGKFLNPKSIITTGAMIGQIAENGGLKGFSLDLNELKKKLNPTTKFFGKLSEQLEFTETIISPDNNRATVTVSSLPFRIGVRQLDTPAYPSRPFYTLDFDDYKIEDRVKGRLGEENENNADAVRTGISDEKTKIRRNMPLKITIERDMSEDIEQLNIEEIIDKNGDPISKNCFSLQIQSMSEIENFWLDSGIFSLNVNNTQY